MNQILHDAHVAEYEHSLYSAYYLDEEEATALIDDEVCDYPPYRPCCQCGEENSERDSFMNRFICGPCWTAEDDAVANAERRSNRSLC